MALIATVWAAVTATQSGALDLGTPTFQINPQNKQMDFSNGTLAGQVSVLFSDKRTIAASGTDNLDLAGSLVDALGAVITFATVKAIYIKAAASNVNDVVIGNGTNPVVGGPFGAAGANLISVKPGGVFQWVAPGVGATVTPATGDILKIVNSGAGTGVDYEIILLGT
jgi:hypothetical protein